MVKRERENSADGKGRSWQRAIAQLVARDIQGPSELQAVREDHQIGR